MFYSKFVTVFIASMCLTGAVFAAPVKVVTISDDFASIVQSIGGDHVAVTSLIAGSRNLHSINPKPSMVMMIKNADLLIRLGMAQDKWIDGLIHVAKNPNLFPDKQGYLDASKNIEKLEIPQGNIDASMGDVHLYGNPHYWLNPANGIVIAKQIMDRLIAIDPDHAIDYQARYRDFSLELKAKIKVWKQRLEPYQKHNFVTYHKAWSYFFDGFNLRMVGELEPLPGIAPTTKHLVNLSKKLKQSNVPTVVLSTIYYPKKISQSFAKKQGAKFVFVSSSVGSDGVTSYTELFDYLVGAVTK
tara:strand:- start:1906 stop:2805 length:900 start_codon:yes stop_codon:yes gene_type:complete